MFDSDTQKQLQDLFSSLENKIELVYDESQSEDQNELLEMLKGIASTAARVSVRSSQKSSVVSRLEMHTSGRFTGISFRGIPGGHEFSSLILGILNSDGKGKMPDPAMKQRIARLRGPIQLRTYVSLTCENCPDVVQTLNQMALVHADFKHEMVDGRFAQDEIQKLGIQGVPAVFLGDRLVYSGKLSFLDLLKSLESALGVSESVDGAKSMSSDLGHYDMVVIGGGPAGITSAIYSARKGLKTAIVADRLGGQVMDTKGIENMISIPYTEGPMLSAQLREHASKYAIDILEHRRVEKLLTEGKKRLLLEGGESLSADAVMIATGAKWRELGVPGEKEYLGRGVAFCPHCDGPFYKGKKVAVVGGGNSGVEAAIDLAGIVREVVLIEYGEKLKADQVLVDKLRSLPHVSVITNAKTQQILGNGEKVVALEYQNRVDGSIQKVDLDGVFVQIGLLPNTGFVRGVVDLSPFGEILVDPKGRTSVPGIYAAGDVTTTPFKQIVVALGEGAKAALTAFEDRIQKVG